MKDAPPFCNDLICEQSLLVNLFSFWTVSCILCVWDVSYRDRVVDICRPFQDKAQYIKQQKQDNILNNMKLLVEVQTECLVFPTHNVTQLENVKDKPGYWDITVMKMKSNIFDNLHIDNGDKQNDDIVTLSLKPNKPEKTQKSQNNEIEKTFSLTSENHQ